MTDFLIPFVALVRKDLRLHFANRRAVVMGILAPIAIAAFFGLLFDTRAQAPSAIPVAVADLDHSALSARIVAALGADSAITLAQMPEDAARAAVTEGKLRAAIVLPQGLADAAPGALFGFGTRPVITVVYDPSQAAALAVVRGLLTQHVMTPVSQSVFGGQDASARQAWLAPLRRGLAEGSMLDASRRRELQALFDSVERVQQAAPSAPAASGVAAAASAGGGLRLPFETRELQATARAGRAYNSFAHSFAGMSVQFILFAGIEFGIAVLTARRMGLWKRLCAAPISRQLLLGSRLASGALIALVLLAAIYAAAIVAFGVRIDGSLIGFVGIALAFALLTSSFGLLIAALGRTPEATRALAIFATLLLVMLGGAWVPSFIFPGWLQTVSLFVPTRWAVDGLDAMTWRGGDLSAAIAPIAVTTAFAFAFGAIALWRFPTDQDGAPGG